MSWSVSIPPYIEDGPEEVDAEHIEAAINAAQPNLELAPKPTAQLVQAKTVAIDIVTGALANKRAYRISLSGHADPGDQSTSADMLSLSVYEVR